MSKVNLYRNFLVVLFLICFTKVSSQIVTSSSAGCVPFSVNFTSPSGANNILWNFGNSITSTIANPSNNYITAGNYTVTLTCNLGTFTTLVVANAKPTANFLIVQPSSGCAVKTVSFTDQSTGSLGANIVGWSWTFGDGGASTASGNTSYGYTIKGSYSVTLKVTDNNNCDNTITKGTINVSNQPTLVIGNTGLSSCTAPYTATFSGNNCSSGSPLGGGLTYNWNLNGQISTQQNPGSITFTNQGTFPIALTVTDNNNCSTSNTVNVSIIQSSINVIAPSTICLNSGYSFTASSVPNSISVNFGDGTTASYASATTPTIVNTAINHIYTTPGTYTVVYSSGFAPCIASVTKTIHVQQVIANFTYTPPSFTCSPTFTLGYINQSSSNATTFTWVASSWQSPSTNNYTIINSSPLSNPVFTVAQISLNPYTIYNTYNVQVSLIAGSAAGCVSTATLNVFDSIKRPTAWFTTDKMEGCAPLVVKFRDSSFTNTQIFPITSYTWNNGASPATIITGNSPPPIVNPTFTYTAPGTYTPFLTIGTASGCIDVSYIHTITVVSTPTISFSVNSGTLCWNQPVQITNTSPPTVPPIQHWHVQSDNSYFSHCVNDPNPSGLFTHFGTHTFTMSGYHHSCKGTSTIPQTVYIKGPIVQGRFETNCTPGLRKTVIFNSNLQDAQFATLNYGDGTPVFTITGTPNAIANNAVTHVYAATGDYTATLTGFNALNGCPPYTYTMQVRVRDIDAKFTLPAVGCNSLGVLYDATSSVDVNVGCGGGYKWYVDNLPPIAQSSPTLNNAITAAGIHTVVLLVRDINSCTDTAKKTIRISGVAPSFTFGANPICYSTGTVQLINNTPNSPDPIVNTSWHFINSPAGTNTIINGSVSVYNYGLFSVNSPNQVFSVVLTATNSLGCVDSVLHTIQVNKPSAFLSTSISNLCIGATVNFTAPQSYPNYTYSFGPPSQTLATSNNTAVYTYTNHGSFTASLIVKDAIGCTANSSIPVNVQNTPTANFVIVTASNTIGSNICSGSPVTFSSTSSYTPYPVNYNWNIGSGSPVISNSVVVNTYTVNQNTTIPVTLTVTTTFGCTSVITKTFSIYTSKADINLDKTKVCFGESIKVNLKDTSSVYAWEWSFGDGSPITITYPNISNPSFTIHPYIQTQTVSVYNTTLSLNYYSPQLSCKQFVAVPIQIITVLANFNRNTGLTVLDSVHCLGKLDVFNNTTPNANSYNNAWSFGDGGISSAVSPSYTYLNSGVFTVSVTVTDPVNNCKGSAIKNMTINPLPGVKINAPDSVCQNKPFNLTSTTTGTAPTVSYQWTPTLGLSNPTGASTSATAATVAQYSLNITDANGCKSSTTSSTYIQFPPLPLQWDSTVIIGQTIPINGYAGNNMSYTWTPPLDLNCIYCMNPVSSTTVNTTYSVTVADNLGCFSRVNTYTVYVKPESTIDVPTAFTPNGDGKNDIIYVDGWGIKKLTYFRVFNRWGQLLFETNDIKVGWDGIYNGVPQNMETYVYQVSGESYLEGKNKVLLKTGTFKLIR